jgi:hypothetical protein
MGTGSFPGVKRPERDADPSLLLVPRSENRVALYIFSPLGPSWPVVRVKPTYIIRTTGDIRISASSSAVGRSSRALPPCPTIQEAVHEYLKRT